MMSSHFDQNGHARMVDVSRKAITERRAKAAADVVLSDEAAEMVRQGNSRKGDVVAIARIAAIQATKLTQNLIPLCHSLPVESVNAEFAWPCPNRLTCIVEVVTTGKTGVEMEAMTGASIAALTVYDMVKSVDRAASIESVRLLEKSGGKSGHYRRHDESFSQVSTNSNQ